MKQLLSTTICFLSFFIASTYGQAVLQASSKVIVDDGYDHAELSVTQWGGSHGLFFGSKINYTGSDHLWGSGNAVFAAPSGQYSYGAFSMGYIANGGVFGFYDGGQSTGLDNPINWTPVMTMVRGGNIGIGINDNNPEAKLDINGDVLIRNDANLKMKSANNDPGDLIFQASDNTEYGRVYSEPDKMHFSAGASTYPRMTIVGSSGNIGIGTTSPGSYRLAVEGIIGARKVKVTQAPWADFVFEDQYKLRSLAELEAFIKKNKHLPKMPSAKEVEANGVDLGDNQALLLQKIEELTLYVIQQQKEIESLKSEIKSNKRTRR